MTKPPSPKKSASVKKPKSTAPTARGSNTTKVSTRSRSGTQESQEDTQESTLTISSDHGLKKVNVKNLATVPEYIIREAATYLGEMFPDEPNSYNKVLEEADEYYKADMTPLFFLDRENMMIIVVAEETLGKVLH